MELDFNKIFEKYILLIYINKYRFKSIGQQIISCTIQQFSHSEFDANIFSLSLSLSLEAKIYKKKKKICHHGCTITVTREIFKVGRKRERERGEKKICCASRCFSKIAKYAKLFPRVGKSRQFYLHGIAASRRWHVNY